MRDVFTDTGLARDIEDPESKLLLAIEVGPRTVEMAQWVVHQLAQRLASTCVPMWLSDGSDIHVMLALRRSSRQVVVADKQLDGTDMVSELLGKRQRLTYQA